MSGSEFKAWRKSLGFTQEGAAGALGISRRSVQMYEKAAIPVPRKVELACETVTAACDTNRAESLLEQAFEILARLRSGGRR